MTSQIQRAAKSWFCKIFREKNQIFFTRKIMILELQNHVRPPSIFYEITKIICTKSRLCAPTLRVRTDRREFVQIHEFGEFVKNRRRSYVNLELQIHVRPSSIFYKFTKFMNLYKFTSVCSDPKGRGTQTWFCTNDFGDFVKNRRRSYVILQLQNHDFASKKNLIFFSKYFAKSWFCSSLNLTGQKIK